MTYETAVALAARFRSDKKEVVQILCAMASAAHSLGEYDRRDDTIEVAANLIAPCSSGVQGV